MYSDYFRKIITYARHILVKIFLGMSLDASGAYRCFYLKKINLKDILSAKNNHYAFFWEVTYIILKKGYRFASAFIGKVNVQRGFGIIKITINQLSLTFLGKLLKC